MKKELLFNTTTNLIKKMVLLSAILFAHFGFAQQGAALHFDGMDDYVNCGYILPTTYTKEAWIYIDNLSLQNNIISGGISDGQHAFWVPNTNAGKLSAGHNGFWYSVQDSEPLQANTWHHVAVTYDAATTTMMLYKNGVLVSTNTNVPPVANGNIVRLGSFDNGANLFSGALDEVRIWNRVLTPCEIENNKNTELATGQDGLVAYYKFNQGNANVDNSELIDLIDATDNGNDGSLNNFLLNGTTSNWIAPGSPASGISGNLFESLSTNATQQFCNAAQVSDLTASGSGILNWYDVNTGGTPLNQTQSLSSGTYYVSQTMGTCETERIPVNVTVNSVPAPTATAIQNFNANATVSNIVASGSNLNWYLVASGGNVINLSDALTTATYYVSQTIDGCESERTAVQVTINGGSLNFNSSTDKVNLSLALNSVIDPINTFTVESWVYPTAMDNDLGNNVGMIVGNYNTLFVDMQFMLRKEGTAYQFWVNDSGTTNFKAVTATNAVVLNQWQHVAGVWNGSDLKIYINGVLANTTTGVTGASFKSQLNNPIQLGKNLSNEKFVGNIDEVRMWIRALSAEELLNNINCELPTSQSGLIAYYKFNQGIDNATNAGITTLLDSSGNNYNGTLINFGLNGTISNWSGISPVTTGNSCPPFLANTVFEDKNFNLYPNPTSGIVNISYSKPISEVLVINMLGQTVLDQKANDFEVQVDLTQLSKAAYFVKVISEGATKTIKVVK